MTRLDVKEEAIEFVENITLSLSLQCRQKNLQYIYNLDKDELTNWMMVKLINCLHLNKNDIQDAFVKILKNSNSSENSIDIDIL